MDEDIRNYSPSDESFEDFPLQISPMCSDDGSPPPPKRLMLMVHSACQVVTPSFDPLAPYLSGKRQRHIKVFEDPVGGGVGIAVNHEGLIVYIGRTDRMRVVYKDFMVERHIDATGMSVLPGFVDAHTHPVWAGDRIDEFGMKLRGLSYMEIHESGGGIFSTVDATSKADTDYLYDTLCERLKKMAESGTTLAECKSGYGLELDKEVRLLEILNKAKSSQRNVINMSITYCGAHAIPRNSNMKETTERIIDVDLPHIANLKKTGKMRVENVDVFCDEGVFSEENAELILWKAKSLGFQLNFHGDEHHPMNSGQMAARVGATAISHLEKITEDDIRCMKEKNIFAVLLPSPAYSMGVEPPPARALIRADVPVALGSDFNPNVYCYSMPLVMNLACVYLKMTMEEALVAATLNAAASLGKSDRHGSIVYNKFADLVIIKSPRWENIIYDFGNHGQIIKFVVKGGNIVKAPKSYDGTLPLLRTDDVLQSPKRSQSAQIRERKEKRMERKRRHSTSNSGTPTKAKVPHTSILGWYREQIVTIKKKFREDMQATTWRYGRYINQNAGLFQCLLQDASDEKESQECDSMLYRLLASDTSAGQGNVNQPQAGPSNVNQPQAGPSNVKQPQAGPSNVKQPQAGPSNVKQPQAGPSNVNQPQAGPSNVKQPQAGPSNLKQPQAGSSSVKHPQAGPSNVNQPQAGLFYVNQPQSVPFNVNQPQAGPSNVKQPQAGPSNVKQPQAGSSSVKHPQAGPSNVNLPQAGLFYVNQFQSVPFNVNQPQAGPSNVNQPQAGLVYVNQPQTGPSNINHPQAGPSNVNQLQAGLFYVNQPQSVPFNVNQPQGPFNVNQLQAGLVYVNQPQLAPFNVNQPRGPFNVNQPQAGPSNVDQLQAVPTNVNQTQAGPTNTPPNLALPQGSTSHNLPPYGERPSAVYFYLPPSQALANPYPGHALLTTGHHLYHPTEQNIAPSRTDQDVSESEQNANPSSETRNETE